MSVCLTSMSDWLKPGINLWFHGDDEVTAEMIGDQFPNIRKVQKVLSLNTLKDFRNLPDVIATEDTLYERKHVFFSFEYAQGSGRLRGGVEADKAELSASAAMGAPEGMVATYRWHHNPAREALDAEVNRFLTDYSKALL